MSFFNKNILALTLIFISFLSLKGVCEDPVQLTTEKDDISLTDDINIARAQVARYPENPEAHFNLAIALSRSSLVEDAIKELRNTKKIIRKSKDSSLIENKIKEYKEIIENDDSKEVNNIRYRIAFAHYLKAYFISKEIEKEIAKKQDNKKNNLDLFSSEKLLLIENNPEIKENLEKSIYYFKDLLKIDPSDHWAKIYYAFILAEQFGKINEAKKLWLEVKNSEPTNPAPYLFLGELHVKEGKLKEGLIEISKAILLRSSGY